MARYKCTCGIPDIENWRIVRDFGVHVAVKCKSCGNTWHTESAYKSEIKYDEMSDYQWYQETKQELYHKRDSGSFVYNEGLDLPDHWGELSTQSEAAFPVPTVID